MKFFLLILLKTLLLHPTNIILLLFFHQTSLSNCSTKKHQFHQASPLFFSNPKFKHRTKRKNFLASPRSCSPFFFLRCFSHYQSKKKKQKITGEKKKIGFPETESNRYYLSITQQSEILECRSTWIVLFFWFLTFLLYIYFAKGQSLVTVVLFLLRVNLFYFKNEEYCSWDATNPDNK